MKKSSQREDFYHTFSILPKKNCPKAVLRLLTKSISKNRYVKLHKSRPTYMFAFAKRGAGAKPN